LERFLQLIDQSTGQWLDRAADRRRRNTAEALDWQPHTVRGAIAGAVKKRLELDVTTSEKDEKRGRIYRAMH
jgi:hypothetical protein